MLRLSRKNLWMVPTAGGLWTFAFWFFLLAGAVNYQNNLGFLMVFLMAAVGLVSIAISFRNMSDRTLQLPAAQWLFANQPGQLQIETDGPRPAGQFSLAYDEHHQTLERIQQGAMFLPWTPTARGYQLPPKIEVGSLFPFGWLHVRHRWQADPVLVFPEPIAGPRPKSIEGEQAHSIINAELTLQDYQAGDPLKRVQWKRVREHLPWPVLKESGAGGSDALDYRAYPGASWEQTLSYLTHAVLQRQGEGPSFTLRLPGRLLGPDAGPAFVRQCLTALAEQDSRP